MCPVRLGVVVRLLFEARTFTAPTYTITDLLRVFISRYKSGQS